MVCFLFLKYALQLYFHMYSLCYHIYYKFIPLYYEMGFIHKTMYTKFMGDLGDFEA